MVSEVSEMAKGLVKVFEVLFDGPEDGPSGPAGDGTFVARFRRGEKKAAEKFASENTAWGSPAKVTETEVPRRTAERWGVA